MEINGNPWNLSRIDRANWADGLDIPTMAEKPDAEVLYWVGCAASYDDRAKKIARATAKLLQGGRRRLRDPRHRKRRCTGDPARRAGNEYLFAMLAEQNVATLNGYKEQGGMKKIVTTCPHCFNTLKNEYPDFGAQVRGRAPHRLPARPRSPRRSSIPKKPVAGKVVVSTTAATSAATTTSTTRRARS